MTQFGILECCFISNYYHYFFFTLGPKPRWVPLDIEPTSVRPKGQKIKSARSPKDVSNSTQDGRRSASKGLALLNYQSNVSKKAKIDEEEKN